MLIFNTADSLRAQLAEDRMQGNSIGFVPTMGALHAGHCPLFRRSLGICQRTVVSIFINPKQFCSQDDFSSYPRTLEKDVALLEKEGVNYCFVPLLNEMWPHGSETVVDTTNLSKVLLGRLRPGHFSGVTTVVAKLFNIVSPEKAFFGEKDFQQLALIRRMVLDLSFPIEIIGVQTLRDTDGVAYSSRNRLLDLQNRKAASVLPRAWRIAEDLFLKGERSVLHLVSAIWTVLQEEPRCKVESIDLCDVQTLDPVCETIETDVVILLTACFGEVRLIDQHILGSGKKNGYCNF